jgi:hypothetical protein
MMFLAGLYGLTFVQPRAEARNRPHLVEVVTVVVAVVVAVASHPKRGR